jgi:signal transduction histidine kinase/DNA-binding response OmpR family regulator/HPt (histidine-containing phosphotransfer) domain-containing protein
MRVISLVSSIVIAIVAANQAIAWFFTQQRLQETIQKDLTSIVDLADTMVSMKIDLLRANAATIAQILHGAQAGGTMWMEQEMRRALPLYRDFMALTVFDRDGVVASYGDSPTPASYLTTSEYLQSAFEGKPAISTTRFNEISGKLVFHICVPIGRPGTRVLAVTIPGMLFSELLNDFRFWDTGSLFMLDENGVTIGTFRKHLVQERANFIETAENGDIRALFRAMTEGGQGFGQYVNFGQPRYCAWKSLSGAMTKWSIGVAAPMNESPMADVQESLLISAVLLIAIGVFFAVLVSGNITKPFKTIEKQNVRLRELSDIARNASEAKSRFLANTSHEMRMPLNAVIGLSELTLGMDDLGPDSARENIEKVYHAGVTLLSIVNDLLDLSKIEAGKFELSPTVHDLPSLINDVIALNLVRIGSKPITFSLDIDPKLFDRVQGDELRVKQIFNNLLSNAFKYTRVGAVRWSLECERDGDSVWLVSSVSDTGIGIKPEDIDKIFSTYGQVDTKSNRQIEGTGLGLSITRRLVEMMDGEISVKSEYGKGSVFTVRLRQGFVSDVMIGEEIAKNLSAMRYTETRRIRNDKLVRIQLPYAKVLVVDDAATNLDVARGILKPYGMRVDCAMSGAEAVELVRRAEVRYNAIFMDHMMPEMDGIEAVRRIRELGTDYAKNLPIFALTANAIVGNEEMFLGHGFQEFLSKPIDIMAIDAVIRRWVRDKSQEPAERNEREAETTEAAGAAETANLDHVHAALVEAQIEGLNVKRGIALFGEERAIYFDVLRSYVKNQPLLFDRLRWVTPDTLADYAITVHGIKGSSRNIGADDLGVQAEALEHAARNGDFAFVLANGEAMIRAAERMVAALSALFAETDGKRPKPRRPEPDAALLSTLRDACDRFDIDGVDIVLTELERYTYESGEGNELVKWLREQVRVMGFKQMARRLSADGAVS